MQYRTELSRCQCLTDVWRWVNSFVNVCIFCSVWQTKLHMLLYQRHATSNSSSTLVFTSGGTCLLWVHIGLSEAVSRELKYKLSEVRVFTSFRLSRRSLTVLCTKTIHVFGFVIRNRGKCTECYLCTINWMVLRK